MTEVRSGWMDDLGSSYNQYTVEVKLPGGLRVVKVAAVSPAHALAVALEEVGVSARIIGADETGEHEAPPDERSA